MDAHLNFYSDDLAEIREKLAPMRSAWGLSQFALWTCSGSMLRVDFAAGPEARGAVRATIELLPKSFVEKLANAAWNWERPTRGTPRFEDAHFGKGVVTKLCTTKVEVQRILAALDAPEALVRELRAAKVSRAQVWIDETDLEDKDTVFQIVKHEKVKHLVASWETACDGVQFQAELDVAPPSGRAGYGEESGGLLYVIKVKFDVTPRRDTLLAALEADGITTANGVYEASRY